MPVNVAAANTFTESFIGAPIPRYNPSDPYTQDDTCVAIYNIYKPIIFDFFQACNNPTIEKNKLKIKLIMSLVRSVYHRHGHPSFFQNAVAESLIPPPSVIPPPVNAAYDADWCERWYNMLFGEDSPVDSRLSIVIQGGEAVNFYTANKYENVPTHDSDTRILAGDHFNYMTKLEDVHIVAKDQMHRYRFFLAFGLMAYMRAKTISLNNNAFANYTSKFLPQWTQPAIVTFDAHWNSEDFYNLIRNGTYGGLGNDFRLERLLAIGIRVQVGGIDRKCWVVDCMCPFKIEGPNTMRMRVGQSDRLHTYFSTDQAISTSDDNATPPNPPGMIPSFDFQLSIDPSVPILGSLDAPVNINPITVRMVPLGFMIFETLRMLFVSKYFQSEHIENKMTKYKQKLNVLLSTLMREEPSRNLFDLCLQHKSRAPQPPANPPILNPENNNQPPHMPAPPVSMQQILLGGKAEVVTEAPSLNPLQSFIKSPVKERSEATNLDALQSPVNDSNEDNDILMEARKYSRELINKEKTNVDTKIVEMLKKGTPMTEIRKAIGVFTIPEPESMTPAQEIGYMDYLSYQHPDFKIFRLSVSNGEEKDMSKSTADDSAEMIKDIHELLKIGSNEDLVKVMNKNVKTTGGYRKKTPRNKKSARATRRK